MEIMPAADTTAPPSTIEQPAAAPAPAVPAAEPAATPDPKDLRASIEHNFKNAPAKNHHAARQPRDNGKFAGPPSAGQESAAAVAAPAVQRPAMPMSLKKELAQHWEKTPAELAAAIIQREQDYEKGVTPLKQQAREYQELMNEFKPYEQLIRSQNATPRQVVASLMRTASILHTGSPVERAQAVAQTMRQFQIPVESIQQFLSGNAPQQPALDPQFQSLAQQVEQLKTLQQQQQESRYMEVVRDFSADSAHKHLDAVAPAMMSLLQSPEILGLGEGATDRERLKAAYEAAIRLNPELSKQIEAERQAADTATRQAETARQATQARQAAVQVKGAPASGPAPKVDPRDLRSLVAHNLRRGA